MVWEQLRQLRECCDVRLESYLDPTGKLGWRITISHRSQPTADPIRITAPEIEDAARRGVQAAQERGWLSQEPHPR